MATVAEKPEREVQEEYLKLVRFFFEQVKSWLPDDWEAVALPERTIQDSTGEYRAGMMSIRKKGVPEPDDFIADIFPMGATPLLGKGLLEISGPFGEEKLIYFCRDTIPRVEYQEGKIRPLYRGVEQDGWYWLESSMSNRALLVDQKHFFDLVRLVSFYDSE